ncbi:MAG TPA: cation:proton antiporter, partial [Rhodospirillales bacterium]
MSTGIEVQPLFDLMVGGLIVAAILLKTWFDRIGVPALVGLLVLGLLIRVADDQWSLISAESTAIFEFLARIGVVVLLFKVGLECNPQGLIGKLRQAVPVWLGNVGLSGLGGYLVAAYGLGLAQVPSLFIAIALTATTVAVSAAVWDDVGALNSANGMLLLDVAELDDISAIFMMALLIAVVPSLETAGAQPIMAILLDT